VRARIEPMAGGEDLDIPMPAMAPSWRVAPRERAAMDTGTRRLAIFAGVIGGALLLLVGVWSFSGHRHAGVPVIEADSRPLRVKPANPGGMQVADANESILSGEGDGKEAMAPPPETPAPQALKAEEQATSPAAAASAPPPPVAAAPPAAPPPPAPPVEAARPAMPATLPTPPHPAVMASAKPLPAPTSLAPTPLAPTALAPVALAPGAAKPAVAPGGVLVQLAAVDSEDAAKAEWARLARRYPDLLGSRAPSFSRTTHAGKVFWRVRTGGFADTAQAVVFCERIKAKGAGCSVASF
jgi:hypothetical protein